jgi:hypothetical protein
MIFQNGPGVARNEQNSRYQTGPERGVNATAPHIPCLVGFDRPIVGRRA